MYTITPQTGYYVVSNSLYPAQRAECVTCEKVCTCGGTKTEPCAHIVAVAHYLLAGGQRATAIPTAPPKPPAPSTPPLPATAPTVCPICGAPVISKELGWRCQASAGHYWAWRGEQSGVRQFLTQPHPAKAGAFYGQSEAERAAFLAAARKRTTELYHGGTPYT